jgi:hypothetical protein
MCRRRPFKAAAERLAERTTDAYSPWHQDSITAVKGRPTELKPLLPVETVYLGDDTDPVASWLLANPQPLLRAQGRGARSYDGGLAYDGSVRSQLSWSISA